MALWRVTFEPTNLLDDDQFGPEEVGSVLGRATIHAEIDQVIDAGATAVHVTPVS